MNYPTPCFPTGFTSRRGNLVANVTQFSLGGTIADLFTLDYSRIWNVKRIADTADCPKGYAADGLRNLMVTLKQDSFLPSWLATQLQVIGLAI